MSDKDQFTFADDDFQETELDQGKPPQFDFGDDDSPEPDADDDGSLELDLGDDDDFPETDLSAAFSDGEFEAENQVPDVVDDPVVEKKAKKGLFGLGSKKAKKPKKEKKPKKVKPPKEKKPKKEKAGGGGSPKTRVLLLVLLLVIGAGAGAFYFMDLGGSTPSMPTTSTPAKKVSKSVALPPQPVKKAPAPVKPQQPAKKAQAAKPKAPEPVKSQETVQAKPVKVAVPKPPPVKPAAKPAPVEKKPQQPAAKTAEAPVKPVPAKQQQAPVQVSSSKAVQEVKPQAAPVKKEAAKPVASAAAKPVVDTKSAVPSKPVAVKQVADGAYMLDAGSYLFESNLNALVTKIEKLGYKTLVTPVKATLDMIRLRLGTFSKAEVAEALAFARSIESGAYSSPAGDGYVIYAGTFLQTGNVDKLTKRFLAEGIKVHSEPVQVVRTLSRIRFGSFATKADAATAAKAADKAGVKAVVVKSK